MGLTYYDEFRKPKTKLANALIVVNGLISFAMAFYWSGIAWFMSDPVRWAMRSSVSVNPAWLEYPYVMLWLVPMLCMTVAWAALKGGQDSIARIVGVYPSLLMAMSLGWFYLAPQQWL